MCGADWTGEALELTVTLPRIPCSSHAQTFPRIFIKLLSAWCQPKMVGLG